ncbi:PglZ domain-containing protein [Agriterribacter sp.]|uniref:PglZ domain-containing protein n=1 Tax=Agriterribacter sp. TaxID=2821509 RepID=UPI002CB0417F|nr:PglZ domain-containing protein [Agriterribacter sp.]HRO46470.1 PglZ domain-containing protein [Agriterribacter sp.]HRQ17369.1 PglZ domain-containing protein [Agriterribacter sp.]
MTEQWLIQDIKKLLQHRNRVVLLDPTGQCSFALPILQQNHINTIQTDNNITEQWQQEKEELMLRHEAETTFKEKPLVFYVTRPQDKLSFLFDYCFTHGCLDLSHPQDWLKKKIFTHTGLQVQLDNPMLLTAAKLGIGKDIAWWKKIVQDLEEVINLDDELLPFVHNPDAYLNTRDADIKRLFEEKLHELLSQQYISKPPKTLADEVVKRMLDGLVNNEISETLLALYYKWADSATYRPSLETYIRNYKLNGTANPWNVHPDHCFEKLDLLALKQIAENIRDKSFVSDKLQKLEKRIFSSRSQLFVPAWWHDVVVLFHADTNPLSVCNSLNAFIEYYTGTFSKVDRAIRNLYEVFLNDGFIIRPLQEYYEGLNHLLLQTWFGFYSEYKSDQQSYLPKLFSTAKPKTAVIVGDGVRYEIADFVANELQKHSKVEKQIMMADMPSETEHNMSALYVGNKKVVSLHKDREASLTRTTGKAIVYMPLEQLNYGIEADYLVLTYKDIDSAGEKLQQAAIKLFSEFEAVLVDKIAMLLNIGYQEVYLVTDHGFVLTGLLDEADKIEPNATGKKEVHERFIRTVDKQANSEWLAFEEAYAEYKYVYAAKNHRPFKSKGVYGFSHGGFTPQEIIIPKFKFSKIKSQTSQLDVFISNKQELTDTPSELFVIRLDAPKAPKDLFSGIRKVQIKLYAGNKEYQGSDIFSIESNSIVDKEFSFSGNTQVQAVLLDAITQEQLDTAIIKKSNLRDLGGL